MVWLMSFVIEKFEQNYSKKHSVGHNRVKKSPIWADIMQKHAYGQSRGTVKMFWLTSFFIKLFE